MLSKEKKRLFKPISAASSIFTDSLVYFDLIAYYATGEMPIDEFSWQEMVVGNGSSFHKKSPDLLALEAKKK